MHVAILRRVPKASASMDVYADNLIKGLNIVRPNWKITSLHPKIPSRLKSNQNLYGGLIKYYQRYFEYPTSLYKVDADIFHIIDHSDGYICRFLRYQNRPNVVTCHDIINLTNPETFKNRARFPTVSLNMWRFGIRGMHYADRVITVSDYTKQQVIKHLKIDENRIGSIPNAVDKIFHSISKDKVKKFRSERSIKDTTFCLLNVGSNNARKNISSILNVTRFLKEKGCPIIFWKVGADFDDKQKEFIHRHHLTDCVRYMGQPNEEDLVLIYNAADCLLAPSFCEGFGLTILEAMACGTPVITSDISAMPEVAGDAAILVDPYDSNSILNAILSILNDEVKRYSFARKGLDRVKKYSWEETAEQVARVYEQILGRM